MEGNANIEIETSSYDDWLAKQGLASPHLHKYNLEMKVEDITSEDSDSNINKGDIDEEVHESGIDVENKLEENVKMSDKLDILTQEVQGMISRGEGEAESEKRKSRLEMILKLLSDEKAETKKIPEKSESALSIHKEIMEKADKPNSGTQVIKPVKEKSQSSGTPKKKPGPKSSKVKKAKRDMSGQREPLMCKIKKKQEDELQSVTKVIKPITKTSVTPQKVKKTSEDENGKIEVSDEGGGASVDSEEAVVCKIDTDKVDEPQSVTKVIESDEGSCGTPKKTECADTQIDNMNKDDKDDKNAGTVAMNDLHKRTERNWMKKELMKRK